MPDLIIAYVAIGVILIALYLLTKNNSDEITVTPKARSARWGHKDLKRLRAHVKNQFKGCSNSRVNFITRHVSEKMMSPFGLDDMLNSEIPEKYLKAGECICSGGKNCKY